MKRKFLGAAGTVSGSDHLVTAGVRHSRETTQHGECTSATAAREIAR
jgi:hypothetical protein